MLDIETIIASGEHYKMEVKKAEGGIPNSLWATYSAFANTDGGVILLGISEENKKLKINGIVNAAGKIKNIWDTLNDRSKICVNILFERNIYVQRVKRKDVIVMEIPRADRRDKPIYINNDLNNGTFRRNAEGDYRCSMPEIKAMLRDQSDIASDSRVIEELAIADLDKESITAYRNHFAALKPTHTWNQLDVESFLHKISALGRSESGQLKPTLAGVLMFGTDDVITRVLPDYFLDYREIYNSYRWTDRVVSNLGEWSGNIFDFFFKVVNKLTSDVKVPFRLRNGIERINDTPVHEALREALANAVIHADYYGRQGVVVEKRPDIITISNPGIFRPSKEDVFDGGISDPRNPNIFKMFALLDIGERAGSGLFNIRTIWREEGWPVPVWEESFTPERLKLSIPIELEGNKVAEDFIRLEKSTEKVIDIPNKLGETGKSREKVEIKAEKSREKSDKAGRKIDKSREKKKEEWGKGKESRENPERVGRIKEKSREKIISLMRDNAFITQNEIGVLIGLSIKGVEKNISILKKEGFIRREGPDRGGYWKVN
jgi:predicted HTH transcriptional regulator